jgi:hypothetical protein
MEISVQFQSPAVCFQTRSPTREGVWLAHSWYGRYGEEKNLCSCREMNYCPSAPSQSLYWRSYPETKGGPLGSTTSFRNMFSYSELVTRYKEGNGSRYSAVGIVQPVQCSRYSDWAVAGAPKSCCSVPGKAKISSCTSVHTARGSLHMLPFSGCREFCTWR